MPGTPWSPLTPGTPGKPGGPGGPIDPGSPEPPGIPSTPKNIYNHFVKTNTVIFLINNDTALTTDLSVQQVLVFHLDPVHQSDLARQGDPEGQVGH